MPPKTLRARPAGVASWAESPLYSPQNAEAKARSYSPSRLPLQEAGHGRVGAVLSQAAEGGEEDGREALEGAGDVGETRSHGAAAPAPELRCTWRRSRRGRSLFDELIGSYGGRYGHASGPGKSSLDEEELAVVTNGILRLPSPADAKMHKVPLFGNEGGEKDLGSGHGTIR